MITLPSWAATLLVTLLVGALGTLITVTWRLSRAAAHIEDALRRLGQLEERISRVHALEIAIAELRSEIAQLRREHDREPTGRHAALAVAPTAPSAR